MVNGQWVNRFQLERLKAEGKFPPKAVKTSEDAATETEINEIVDEESAVVEEVSVALVEKELYDMTNAELVAIVKQNNLKITGQPNKKQLVEMLMKKA